ncbi:MAG: thiopeptide-type bacteriocin biosynthesis protein [Minicystis sp.]
MAPSKATSTKAPGSDWLYLKLYCGRGVQDDLIAGPLRRLTEASVSRQLAEQWFFVRYADPEPHVRLRFRGDPRVLTTQLLPELCAWGADLMTEGYCCRFTFDTYDREVERYGGTLGIETAERVFHADSVAVVAYKDALAQRRLPLALEDLVVLTVDNLLAGLGLSEDARLSWLDATVTWRREVGPDFRRRHALLRSLLHEARGEHGRPELDPLRAALGAAREHLRRVVGPHLPAIHGSLVHMHCNRLVGLDRSAERRALGMLLRTAESLRHAPVK